MGSYSRRQIRNTLQIFRWSLLQHFPLPVHLRANYPEKTLADLYDPDKMPEDLREAHEELDRIVESCYPGAPFANDEARLECLFRLYEKMTANKK